MYTVRRVLIPMLTVSLTAVGCSAGSGGDAEIASTTETSAGATVGSAAVAETAPTTTTSVTTTTPPDTTTTSTTTSTTVPTEDSSTTVEPPASTEGESDTTVASGQPGPTVPPGLPEALLPAIRPIQVQGEALAPLEVSTQADPLRGSPAPIINGFDYDGTPVRIDAAQDGPTLVVLLAHWCPHCNDEVVELTQMHADGVVPDGLNVVGVGVAPNPTRANFPPGDWFENRGWPFPAMAEGVADDLSSFAVSSAFGVAGLPTSVLIDGDGNVAARWSGSRTRAQLLDLINTALS